MSSCSYSAKPRRRLWLSLVSRHSCCYSMSYLAPFHIHCFGSRTIAAGRRRSLALGSSAAVDTGGMVAQRCSQRVQSGMPNTVAPNFVDRSGCTACSCSRTCWRLLKAWRPFCSLYTGGVGQLHGDCGSREGAGDVLGAGSWLGIDGDSSTL